MKIIYTKHARERAAKRKLSFWGIEETILHPDKKYHCPDSESEKFIKRQGTRLYHVVATFLPKEQAYLVVSAWVRGEEDQPDWAWRIITLPFRLGWWAIRSLWRLMVGKKT
jgi:hypothetical protein